MCLRQRQCVCLSSDSAVNQIKNNLNLPAVIYTLYCLDQRDRGELRAAFAQLEQETRGRVGKHAIIRRRRMHNEKDGCPLPGPAAKHAGAVPAWKHTSKRKNCFLDASRLFGERTRRLRGGSLAYRSTCVSLCVRAKESCCAATAVGPHARAFGQQPQGNGAIPGLPLRL